MHLAVFLPSPLLWDLLVELIRVDGDAQPFEVGDYPLVFGSLNHVFLEIVCCALRLVSLGRGEDDDTVDYGSSSWAAGALCSLQRF